MAATLLRFSFYSLFGRSFCRYFPFSLGTENSLSIFRMVVFEASYQIHKDVPNSGLCSLGLFKNAGGFFARSFQVSLELLMELNGNESTLTGAL